jgi:multisubunit Na+/H+ antiporter MnhG subunit
MEDRPTIPRLLGVVRKNPGFRRLFAANAVSQMGDWFNVVALFSLLLELTGKGEAVAVVLLARLLPIFFVGPAAGVLADRISHLAGRAPPRSGRGSPCADGRLRPGRPRPGRVLGLGAGGLPPSGTP